MKWKLIVIVAFIYQNGFSQGISSILDKSTNPGEVLVEFDNRSVELKGSYYLLNDWQIGNVVFKSGASVVNQWVNYDLECDILEVKLVDLVKVVPLMVIDNFIVSESEIKKRSFKPCSNYLLNNAVPLVGLCEVIDSNYFGLMIKYTAAIKKATYVPALDMGKKEDEKIVRQKYFLTIGNNAVALPRKKQLLIDLFAPYQDNLTLYMKENKLNYKNRHDLLILLGYLNTLLDH